MKRLMLVLFLALLFFGISTHGMADDQKALTLLIYMTGSDLESENGAASSDIQEMLSAGCDFSQMNLLILVGGSKKWQMGFDASEISLLQIGPRGMRILKRWAGASMGSSETLTSFLEYGASEFPADHFGLVLWDHGGGPMEGICYDELYGKDRLSLSRLHQALAESPFSAENPLLFIGFDACLMASIETAHICADYTRFMIASQETEPSFGWNYHFLSQVEAGMNGADIGRIIVNSYIRKEGSKPMTLSCLDLSRLGNVKRDLSSFFLSLGKIMAADTFSEISNDRRQAKGFGRITTVSDYDLVDLYHLVDQYVPVLPDEAAALKDSLQKMVVSRSGNQENAHGLSIYSPFSNKKYFTEKWLKTYQELDFPFTYLNYMNRFAYYWLGEQLADWSGLAGQALPVGEDGIQYLELALNEEQQAHFGSAKVVILRDQGIDNAYFEVFEIPDLSLENGILHAAYDYSGLFVTDDDGNIMSDMYPFFFRDHQYFLAAQLEQVNLYESMFMPWQDVPFAKSVNLVCSLNQETGELSVNDVITSDVDEDELSTGKQFVSIDPASWPYIYFHANNYGFFETRDSDGRILPYTQWNSDYINIRNNTMLDENNQVVQISEWERTASVQTANQNKYRIFSEVDNTKPWHLCFLKNHYGTQNLYAQFIVTDTQGIESASELIPLYNPSVQDRQEFNMELYRDEESLIRLDSIEVVSSVVERGVRFNFYLESPVGSSLNFVLYGLALNQTMIDNTHFMKNLNLRPETAHHVSILVPADDIPYLWTSTLSSVDMAPYMYKKDDPESYGVMADGIRQSVNLDLSSLHIPNPSACTVWSTFQKDWFDFALVDLSQGKNGDISGFLYILSNGDNYDNVSFLYTDYDENDHYGDIILDGCFLRDTLQGSGFDIPLYGGYDLFIPFTISRMSHLDIKSDTMNPYLEAYDAFAHWNLTGINNLKILFRRNDELDFLDFTLKNPFPIMLDSESSSDPSVTLLENEYVSLVLRSLVWSEGHPRLYVDVIPASIDMACDEVLMVDGCTLNNQPADIYFYSEQSIRDDAMVENKYPFSQLIHSHRMVMDILPSSNYSESSSQPGLLVIRFRYIGTPAELEHDFQKQHQPLEPLEILIPQSAKDQSDPIPLSELSVKPAIPPDPLALDSVLGGAPAYPDNWETAQSLLTLQLTEEAAKDFKSAYALLAAPCGVEGLDDVYFLCGSLSKVYLNPENNQLYVSYNGLLASGSDADFPMCQTVYQENGLPVFLLYDLKILLDSDTSYAVPQAKIVLSEKGTKALSVLYSTDGVDRDGHDNFTLLNTIQAFRLNPDNNGRIPDPTQWELIGDADDVTKISADSPALVLRLASDWNLKTIFIITNQSGDQYGVMLPQ